MAPMDVPVMMDHEFARSGCSHRASNTPTSYAPFAPPPERTNAVLRGGGAAAVESG